MSKPEIGFQVFPGWAFGVDVQPPLVIALNFWRFVVWFGWPYRRGEADDHA